MEFADRVDAGRRLAAKLGPLQGEDLVVVGLPRGGVPVALEVARALDAPLDVIVVRKLGVPFQPELGMGAIGEGGVRVLNAGVVRLARVSSDELAAVEQRERVELERRARRFRGDRPPVRLDGKTVVVVDDGIATGSTARAACQVARAQGAARIVLAVPVAPPDWTDRLAGDADAFVCVDTPEPFFGVGQFYADFSQTTDDEVTACLERGRRPVVAAPTDGPADDPAVRDEEVNVQAGPVRLAGHLTVPEAAVEVVARRLDEVTTWLRAQPETRDLPVGYFGASTGAAAALWAAAESHARIAAVVSRGGRPDLAGPRLAAVSAPTLLIVGGRDHVVIDLNRQAQAPVSYTHLRA